MSIKVIWPLLFRDVNCAHDRHHDRHAHDHGYLLHLNQHHLQLVIATKEIDKAKKRKKKKFRKNIPFVLLHQYTLSFLAFQLIKRRRKDLNLLSKDELHLRRYPQSKVDYKYMVVLKLTFGLQSIRRPTLGR